MKRDRLPHDELVKSLMAYPKVASDFFNAHLPSGVRDKIVLNTLKMEPTSFIDEDLRKHESDLIFSVKLINQEDAFLYCLVEHQSSSDPLMPFRLLYYIMQGLKRHVLKNKKNPLPLPLIFPLVLYNGDELYHHAKDIFPLFGDMEALAREIFLKPFTLIDVGIIPDEDIRKHQWAGLMELSLRRAKKLAFEKEISLLAVLFEEIQADPNDEVVKIVLKYLLYKRDISEQASPFSYEKEMLRILPTTYESTIMNIGQAIEARGEARAMQNVQEAVEMLKQGLPPEQISKETHIELNMVIFLRDNMVH